MSLSKTKQLLNKLKAMADQAGPALYERAGMAAEVLADAAWVAAEHGGDYDRACKAVEDNYFPELGKAMSIHELLTLAREFPQAEWARHKYNLRRLWAEWEGRQEREPKAQRERVTKEDMAKAKDEIKELTYSLKKERQTAEGLAEENRRLRERVAELERVNARLEGRIEELERVLERRSEEAVV
ncbi:MAG TPA: hypothetical protein VEA69_00195 [Tepidisphaeraceae bacterium]|nr:hypothetical protein [Tepidisphaeraceae bacterium]